ncbi:MAG: response regulator, partial [Clostridia bacterium]|nr:response regulator [Clostridia bacterium]
MYKINILFVEDEKELNNLVTSYLKNEGYNVFSCFDGEEAIEIFEDKKIDLIISDIMMPKIDGYALAEKIRKDNSVVPIIFVTAKDDKFSKQY